MEGGGLRGEGIIPGSRGCGRRASARRSTAAPGGATATKQDRSRGRGDRREIPGQIGVRGGATSTRAKETVDVYNAELTRRPARRDRRGRGARPRVRDALRGAPHPRRARCEQTRARIVQHLMGTDASHVVQRLKAMSSGVSSCSSCGRAGTRRRSAYLDGIQRTNLAGDAEGDPRAARPPRRRRGAARAAGADAAWTNTRSSPRTGAPATRSAGSGLPARSTRPSTPTTTGIAGAITTTCSGGM